MNDLLRFAFEEAISQARTLSSEPVAAMIFIFDQAGNAATVGAVGEADVHILLSNLQPVAEAAIHNLTGQPKPVPGDELHAERIAAMVIQRAKQQP